MAAVVDQYDLFRMSLPVHGGGQAFSVVCFASRRFRLHFHIFQAGGRSRSCSVFFCRHGRAVNAGSSAPALSGPVVALNGHICHVNETVIIVFKDQNIAEMD
jgi:hypothetical protein